MADFPQGGAPTPGGGEDAHLIYDNMFAKNEEIPPKIRMHVKTNTEKYFVPGLSKLHWDF